MGPSCLLLLTFVQVLFSVSLTTAIRNTKEAIRSHINCFIDGSFLFEKQKKHSVVFNDPSLNKTLNKNIPLRNCHILFFQKPRVRPILGMMTK